VRNTAEKIFIFFYLASVKNPAYQQSTASAPMLAILPVWLYD